MNTPQEQPRPARGCSHYWDEVRRAVGKGTRSILWGTSTRSLRRSLDRLQSQAAPHPAIMHDPELPDRLGRAARDAWIRWARQQPDVSEHPMWTIPYDQLPGRDKKADRQIGLALYILGWAEARRHYTGR